MKTYQKVFYKSSQDMTEIDNESVALVITSPPYPMIEMWDDIFPKQNPKVAEAFYKKDYDAAFMLIHEFLNYVWKEIYRVLIPGGIACINIGNATRTINKVFRLFTNHSRIIYNFENIGFISLPDIIWRKPTNAPNKFMGSGMYPPGAYVTFEHEYILIFRKGDKRIFKNSKDIQKRRESAYFWEERNVWFSDVWEFKGTSQNITGFTSRERSAAFPFELAYRLVNMYSIKGDTVLDPFLGTGTTLIAALASERNGIGYEIDESFSDLIHKNIMSSVAELNNYINDRLIRHINFIKNEESKSKKLYLCSHHGFSVKTKQETDIVINRISNISYTGNNCYCVDYEPIQNISQQLKMF